LEDLWMARAGRAIGVASNLCTRAGRVATNLSQTGCRRRPAARKRA
jgi:hypothetical protein